MVDEERSARTQKRPLYKKALALIVGIVAALLIGEIIVRVIALETEAHWKIFDTQRAAPAIPDRTKVDPHAAGRKAFRIAFLGDSFTYGLGVECDCTFVPLAGKMLNARHSFPIATVNMGEPGADLIKEWVIYNNLKDKVRPHVVVHVLSENDLDVDLYEGLLAIKSLYEERLWPSRFSRLFAFVECTVRKRIGHRRMLDYMCGGATEAERRRSWRIARCAIEETKRLVEHDGALYVLARFPYLGNLKEPALRETHRLTAELAGSLGVPFLDLSHVFKNKRADEMHLPDDSHPSEAAHSLAARALAEFLSVEVCAKFPPAPPRWKGSIRSKKGEQQAKIGFLQKILRLDPTCRSAKARLQLAVKQQIPR